MKTSSAQLGIGKDGGMLLSVVAQLACTTWSKTAVLAAIGAVVSFAVTWVLQRWRKSR